MSVSRRFFLKSGGVALFGVGAGAARLPGFLARAATTSANRGKTLVVVFQRGAADGLNIVVPHGESAYYDLRPSIAIPRPRKGVSETALDLDGFFGFHPMLAPLKKLFDQRLLAVVHAAGSPDATRSHFDAQDFMESGTPGTKSTSDGWLNRYLGSRRPATPSGFRAVSVTSQLPRILGGNAPALAIPELSRFGFDDRRLSRVVLRGLDALYEASNDPLLAPIGRETFDALERLERTEPARYRTENGAHYPDDAFGRSMLQIAQLIKADLGLEIAFAELGGWDHHVNEGGTKGPLANLLRRFSGGVAAFVRDLGDRMEDVVLVTLSEFGRTAAENGNRGTDHGHANAIFAVGGGIKGGRVLGDWPGLQRDQLYEGRDLDLTTDYRDVMAELLTVHLGASRLDRVFPGYPLHREKFTGLL